MFWSHQRDWGFYEEKEILSINIKYKILTTLFDCNDGL